MDGHKVTKTMWLFHRSITIARSGILKGATDYHSHLLPGVDDGVETLDESLAVLTSMEQQGVKSVWFTPHIMEDIPNETTDLQDKFREVKQSYHGTMALHLAAEYMMDNLFEKRLRAGDILPLSENSDHLLVETSYFNPPMGLSNILLRIKTKGYYPVLAHPERYVYMEKKDYQRIRSLGVKFQLNLPSLAGLYGKYVQKKAEALLKSGMYDLTGSDTHSSDFYHRLLLTPINKKNVSCLL